MKKNIDHNSIIAPNFTKYTDDELLEIYSSSSSDSISSESSDESVYKESGYDSLITRKLAILNDIEFKQFFRMNKSTVQQLIDKYKADQNGHQKIKNFNLSCDTQIYMTLSYLTSRESYKEIAKKYAVRISAFWFTINRTIQWIISQPFINWPSHQEQQISMENFKSQTDIPFVIGAIGVTHIQFKPSNNGEPYRKHNKHSFVLQGVADHRSRFIDIHCGEPGGMDDYTILRKSALYKNLYANPHEIKPQGFIVGNETYPSSNWLVSPFRHGKHTVQQQKFNKILAKPMKNLIDAFAALKSRFQRFHKCIDCAPIYYKLAHLKFLIQSVVACCLLHNFCVERDDHVDTVDASLGDIELDIGCYVIDQGGRRHEIFKCMQNNGVFDN